jgi:hypothetical protein
MKLRLYRSVLLTIGSLTTLVVTLGAPRKW